MSHISVLTHPNPLLRKHSEEIQETELSSNTIKQLIQDLLETMRFEHGIGIAAPQIGVHKRVILVEMKNGPQIFINPRIVKHSLRKCDSEEGCLSVPGIYGIVRRYISITVNALNENGERATIHVNQLPAIIFQHEIDHLNGILFIDKAKKMKTHAKL